MLNQNAAAAATTEVLIVGGGPAGLAAAIALRQRGIDCTVVEACPAGIDKACGEGLMPDSRDTLARLGISLAAAIGYHFLDEANHPIPLNGSGLARLARIVPPPALPRVRFIVATDVDNPLYGPKGAACQFAPQKGADAAMVARLDAGLRRLARIVKRDLGKDLAHEPGAGAAGGCGYGLMAFFNAKRENGFQLVRRLTGLNALVRDHDLIITGEGCLDRTSLLGKAPAQLGDLARRLRRPIWALCGRATLPPSRSPFDRIAALSTREHPGPPPETLTPGQHAQRLELLAYDTASAVRFG